MMIYSFILNWTFENFLTKTWSITKKMANSPKSWDYFPYNVLFSLIKFYLKSYFAYEKCDQNFMNTNFMNISWFFIRMIMIGIPQKIPWTLSNI